MAEKKKDTNIYDVFIRLIDAIYAVVNSGSIIGIIVVIFLAMSFKLSEEHLYQCVTGVGKVLYADRYYLFVLSSTLCVSVYINFHQRKTYITEINRLVEERSNLIHGLTNKKLKPLDEHKSSRFKL